MTSIVPFSSYKPWLSQITGPRGRSGKIYSLNDWSSKCPSPLQSASHLDKRIWRGVKQPESLVMEQINKVNSSILCRSNFHGNESWNEWTKIVCIQVKQLPPSPNDACVHKRSYSMFSLHRYSNIAFTLSMENSHGDIPNSLFQECTNLIQQVMKYLSSNCISRQY